MARNPLQAALQLRRLALNQARRELAECLIAEATAEHVSIAAEAEIAQETEEAASLAGGDGTVESFARWLRAARPAAKSAQLSWDRACAETARARAVLAVTRSALEAAEELVARQAKQARAEEERREQNALDEAARRRPARL